jgi:methyl-accepting chemotaxis protein
VLLVSSDETSCATSIGRGLKQRWQDLAASVGGAADSVRAAATAIGQRRSTTILLTDGLAGTGEVFVADLVKRMPPGTQIVGGAAGDEGEFVGTRVGIAGNAGEDALAALHVFSRRPWGVGVGHGLRPTTDLMKVTRAEGNVIHEIDGQPAFNIYRAHARARGVALDPKNASRYLIGNELGVHVFDRLDRARAPLFVGDDGSLTCAGTVPQGASVSILDGEVDSMLSAAASAAREARDGLAGGEAAAAVLFDCVCRGMILGDQFKREIDAVREALGNVPVVGFLTYGEIARYPGRSSGWHNATAVVLAIPR